MPSVNGKKYPYTAAGKTAAMKAMKKSKGDDSEGYGPNPADAIPLDEYGFVIKAPIKTDKMSKTAMAGKDKSMERFAAESARKKALTKMLAGMIPKSPTN